MAGLPWGIIKLLADGQCHSGEALGAKLGVSRAAVWKMIQQLGAAGLEVESIKGQGYKLDGGLDLLDASVICSRLSGIAKGFLSRLDVFEQIESTNSLIAGAQYGSGSVILAEQQTAGRGRRGRIWVSPLAANIYLSVRWNFTQGIASLEGLSLAVGVVLVDALTSLGIQGLNLKWPNDLWLNNKKLGGVLVEIGGDVTGDCHAIIGVGLNVRMPEQASQVIDQAWADLGEAGYTQGRNLLAACFVEHLLQMLSTYQQLGFGEYRERWMAKNALAGRYVETHGAQAVCGIAAGLNESGGLIIQTEKGERVVNGGEVSVKVHDR